VPAEKSSVKFLAPLASARNSVAPASPPFAREVGVEQQDAEALTSQIEDRGAAHGPGATQHDHPTALIP